MLASARGPQVWAWKEGSHIHAAAEPPATGHGDAAALLVEAIRDAYGEAAGDSAERELGEITRRGRSLPSTVVRRLIESAEAAFSLLQGATYGLRLRYSAVTSGAGFRACCESLGIDYSSSAWDLTSAKEIASLQPSWIKIPSACNTDYAMLEWLCEHYAGGLHVSLGMTTKPEERTLMELLEAHGRLGDTVLYSCTSGYPVAMEDLCLLEISRLADDYGDRVAAIGFSGHHLGIAADIAAITLGAAWVERHFTLDRTWKGTDHAASLEPDGMRRLCRDVRNVAGALRFRDEEILEVERAARSKLKHVARPRLIKAA